MSGARAGCNIGLTRGGSFSLALVEKRNGVANLDDSSLMEKWIERPLLSRVNTGSSVAKDLGVLVLAFPHLKPSATSWPAGSVLELAFPHLLELAFPHLKPTATTWSERGEGERVRLGGRRAVAASSLLRGAWLRGAAREAQDPVPWLRGAAFERRSPVAEFMPRLRGTALLALIPFAELGLYPMGTAHEARIPFAEIGPGLRGTALATQVHCTMRICDRRRRCPWAHNPGNLC